MNDGPPREARSSLRGRRRPLTMRIHALVVLLLVLAGCGGKDPRPTGPSAPVGTLAGAVLDDAEAPVEGASIHVLLTELAATTDAAGGFRIDGVPAGGVRVVASKDGYSTSTRSADLGAGRTVRFHFILLDAPVVRPYNRTLTFNGEIACSLASGSSCSAAVPDPEAVHPFDVDSNLRGIVLELEWTSPAQGVAEKLAFDLLAATSDACGAKYAGAEGTSVLRLVVRDGFPLSGGRQCATVRAAADATAVQQAYTLLATLFYHDPPPGGFSARA